MGAKWKSTSHKSTKNGCFCTNMRNLTTNMFNNAKIARDKLSLRTKQSRTKTPTSEANSLDWTQLLILVSASFLISTIRKLSHSHNSKIAGFPWPPLSLVSSSQHEFSPKSPALSGCGREHSTLVWSPPFELAAELYYWKWNHFAFSKSTNNKWVKNIKYKLYNPSEGSPTPFLVEKRIICMDALGRFCVVHFVGQIRTVYLGN